MNTRIVLRIFAIAGILVLSAKLNICQDIVFPDDDGTYNHASSSAPVTKRPKPPKVDIANTEKDSSSAPCPDNMIRFTDPGNKSASVCDCKPRFVYFPKNDTCHEVFQRGPCPSNHYVHLGVNDTIPECVGNPCRRDDVVPYRGGCHQLRAMGGPCAVDEALNVNETTFQLECFGPDLVPWVIIDAPKRSCPRGSRRSSLGICKLVLR